MLTAKQEFNEICAYFTDLFQAEQPCYSYVCQVHPGRLAEAEVLETIRAIRIGKTIPNGSATASAFYACEGQLLGPITKLMSECFVAVRGFLSIECCIYLLPKPNKSIKRPENLRPLGIQDPATKIYSRIIKTRLYEEVKDTILRFPQFS